MTCDLFLVLRSLLCVRQINAYYDHSSNIIFKLMIIVLICATILNTLIK